MGAIIAGLLPLAIAFIARRRNQVPDDAVIVPGIVLEEVKKRGHTRPRRWMYAPVLSYRHPGTGRQTELHPTGFSNLRYKEGQAMDVAVDVRTGEAMRVPERPWLSFLVPFLLGAAMIAAGIVSLVR